MKKEDVRRTLRDAFAEVDCPYIADDFTPQYWVDMREHLLDLDAHRLHWELPRILEALLDDAERENLDLVLGFLDVARSGDEAYWERRAHDWGRIRAEQDRQHEEHMRATIEPMYRYFTRRQGCAIVQWLEHVRMWTEYNFYSHAVDSAIEYWSHRCSTE